MFAKYILRKRKYATKQFASRDTLYAFLKILKSIKYTINTAIVRRHRRQTVRRRITDNNINTAEKRRLRARTRANPKVIDPTNASSFRFIAPFSGVSFVSFRLGRTKKWTQHGKSCGDKDTAQTIHILKEMATSTTLSQ